MKANRLAAMALIIAAAAIAVGAYAAAKQKPSTVLSVTDLKWAPLNQANPHGPQMAVVWGDPKKGPVGFIGRFPAGMKAPMHWHTGDYRAALIQGTWVHSDQDGPEGKPLEPGSYWFQPGKAPHADECRSATDCLVYIDIHGPIDSFPVGANKSGSPSKK